MENHIVLTRTRNIFLNFNIHDLNSPPQPDKTYYKLRIEFIEGHLRAMIARFSLEFKYSTNSLHLVNLPLFCVL